MNYIKHNAIDNFSTFSTKEKQDLLIQEMSKAFMLYPRACADILDICKINYNSLESYDLSKAVEKNSGDLKMINRIVRLSFLVNKQGDSSMKHHDRKISYRNLMKQSGDVLKNHSESMKEATLLTRDMMKEERFSKVLNKSLTNYLNLDGQHTNDVEKEMLQEETYETKSNYGWILLIAVVGIGIYFYMKTKSNEG